MRSQTSIRTPSTAVAATSLHPVPENSSLSSGGRRKEEIRSEVVDILRAILPDDVENADAMMEDFEGREGQLLESLRKMKEAHEKSQQGPVDPDDFVFEEGKDEHEANATDENSGEGKGDDDRSSDDDDRSSDDDDDRSSDDDDGGARFDVDRWQEDLDSQIDDSSRASLSSHRSHLSHRSLQSNGRGVVEGELPPLLDSPPGSVNDPQGSPPSSNPQSGGGGTAPDAPPERLAGDNNHGEANGAGNDDHRHAEEKKNDSQPIYTSNRISPLYPQLPQDRSDHEEEEEEDDNEDDDDDDVVDVDEDDESDLPPLKPPQTVRTNSLQGFLKISNLTTQDSVLTADSDSDQSSSTGGREDPSSESIGARRAMAVVRLRVWDPSRPHTRLDCQISAPVLVPSDEVNFPDRDTAVTKQGNDRSVRSDGVRRLSMVQEEPEKPPQRGDSYFDDNFKDMCLLAAAMEDGDGNGESGRGGGARTSLEVGTTVGVRVEASKQQQFLDGSVRSARSVTSISSLAQKKIYEWTVGSAVHVHGINFLALSNLGELHSRIEESCPSLRELVLDGLPPGAIALDEAELILEALGPNRSVRRLSMRRSGVDDDVASLFALALVDNVHLTRLNLEGNVMTDVSAKNFYSVLKKNNSTLRVLGLDDNPNVDEDVKRALDQFMEQRALKRTLTNKAEKARRAARGMPPDASLEEEEDESGGDGGVTVVFSEQATEEARERDREREDVSGTAAKPHPGENFRDYMRRMEEVKANTDESPSRHMELMHQSLTDKEAFDNFSGTGSTEDRRGGEGGPLAQYPFQKNQFAHEASPDARTLPPIMDSNESTGSSITTRSTQVPASETDVITTTSNGADERSDSRRAKRAQLGRMDTIDTEDSGADMNESHEFGDDGELVKSNLVNRKQLRQLESMETLEAADHDRIMGVNFRKPPGRMDTMETQESAHPDGRTGTNFRKTPARMDTMETQESAYPSGHTGGNAQKQPTRMDTMETQKSIGNNNNNQFRSDESVITAASLEVSDLPPAARSNAVYHNTQTSRGSNSQSLDISERDYMNDKAREREMRQQLASTGAIGAHHINETAPGRQNRGSGVGRGRGSRRRSGPRTESQRMRRLAQLQGGGDGAAAVDAGRGGGNETDVMIADIERTNDPYLNEMLGQKTSELDEEGNRLDRIACTFMALLLIALSVLVILFFMNQDK